MTKPNGLVLYKGPSLLDGKPIVVIATGLANSSSNSKTGDIIQTWIIRSDIKPTDAINTGDDASICGSCPHRGTIENGKNVGRSCYVTVFQAPLNVYKTYHRGRYPLWNGDPEVFSGRKVRLGAYGDPAAVPRKVWRDVLAKASGWTGYTHQWANLHIDDRLRQWCMASADSAGEQAVAEARGWRTFRVRTSEENLAVTEIACPASDEAGKVTQCANCMLCGGGSKLAKSIAIIAHGSAAKVNAFNAAR